jgi:hypothetical protein
MVLPPEFVMRSMNSLELRLIKTRTTTAKVYSPLNTWSLGTCTIRESNPKRIVREIHQNSPNKLQPSKKGGGGSDDRDDYTEREPSALRGIARAARGRRGGRRPRARARRARATRGAARDARARGGGAGGRRRRGAVELRGRERLAVARGRDARRPGQRGRRGERVGLGPRGGVAVRAGVRPDDVLELALARGELVVGVRGGHVVRASDEVVAAVKGGWGMNGVSVSAPPARTGD